MTERDAINSIMQDRYARNFCLPRYTPRQWWECDVFEVTPAGMFREYEVKLTVADFRADTQKRTVKIIPPWDLPQGSGRACAWPGETKHGLLAEGSPRGPSRFWYVTPKGLLTPEMVPAWAGLIELTEKSYWSRPMPQEVVKAPQLHRQPVDSKVTDHARGICYYRMHGLMQKLGDRAEFKLESEVAV